MLAPVATLELAAVPALCRPDGRRVLLAPRDALLLTWLAGWHDKGSITAAVLGWMVLYAALTWVLPSRQFLHDVISGTRVIDNRKQVP